MPCIVRRWKFWPKLIDNKHIVLSWLLKNLKFNNTSSLSYFWLEELIDILCFALQVLSCDKGTNHHNHLVIFLRLMSGIIRRIIAERVLSLSRECKILAEQMNLRSLLTDKNVVNQICLLHLILLIFYSWLKHLFINVKKIVMKVMFGNVLVHTCSSAFTGYNSWACC